VGASITHVHVSVNVLNQQVDTPLVKELADLVDNLLDLGVV